MSNHSRIDERSLAFGRAIAERVAEHPDFLDRARGTLLHWLETCAPGARPALIEWLTALYGPPEAVLDLLTGTDERAVQLRQSNPFTGVLSPQERTALLRQFQTHDAKTA